MRINLGSGLKPIKGFVNVDVFNFEDVDVKHDLNKYPYPFKNESADVVVCNHIIEHLDDPEKCLSEIHRILKKGGNATIKVPYFAHSLAFSSWQHRHYFTISSFTMLKHHSDLDWWTPTFSKVDVKVNFGKLYKFFPLTWLSMAIIKFIPVLYEDTFLKTLTPAAELEVMLIK